MQVKQQKGTDSINDSLVFIFEFDKREEEENNTAGAVHLFGNLFVHLYVLFCVQLIEGEVLAEYRERHEAVLLLSYHWSR